MRTPAQFSPSAPYVPLTPRRLFAGTSDGTSFTAPLRFAQDDETVRVRRRRPSGAPADDRERASAPQRRRPTSGAPPPAPTGGGGFRPPVSFGGGSPGGGMQIPGGGCGVILLIVAVVAFMLLGGPNFLNQGGSDDTTGLPDAPPAAMPAPSTATPTRALATATRPTTSGSAGAAASAPGAGQTWTVMLYLDADDQVLEKDIYVDLNEVERVGSSDRVNLVAQIDRYRGGFAGDGDWTSTKRFYITQDDDLERVRSQEIADLGEVNMADGAALVDFISWAAHDYPADKYVLILSDHGMGWPGGWSDPTAGSGTDQSTPLAAKLGDQLYLNELDAALEQARGATGIDKFELLGMDACLMAHLEVFTALAPHARYALASQETEPALGWAYTSFLRTLVANPDMNGAELGQAVVASYIQDDQRIVDDQARAELVSRGSPMGGLFGLLGGLSAPSAQEVAAEMAQNVTLTAIDLEQIPALVNRLNELAFTLQRSDQRAVAQARSYAQSFTSIFGPDVPASYIDLGNFVKLLQQASGGELTQATDQVLAALEQSIVAEKHGAKRPGATGVSIYFPIAQLYRIPVAGPPSYTAIADRFAQSSLWDDFLAFHYTGRTFDQQAQTAVVPERTATFAAPGGGGLAVSPISTSASVAAPGQPVLLSTRIQGENVGYIYLFAGFYDQAANSLLVIDSDFLESDNTRTVDGVYYPVWPTSGQFTMEFEWEPLVYAISDGVDRVVTLFKPETYGFAPEAAIYTVDGVYTYAENGATRAARLYFSNGVLRQVFGFTGEDATGAPREIIPQPGDQVTISERWLDLDQNGQIANSATQTGATLTFGEQTFTWQELDAAPGEYVVGFIVEDLAGNQQQVSTPITVR